MFITFEGIDFSGKSTQAKLLADHLIRHKKDVVFLREPGGTAISEKIRALLLDRKHFELTQIAELLLFSASRTQLVSEVILPALRTGKVVVCDRFFDSTTAYQGYGRGLNLDHVRVINAIATAGTTPDLTMLVDVEMDEIVRRQAAAGVPADRMESAGRIFFQRVREGYLSLANAEPQRFIVLNGMRPIETIQDEVWRIVQSRLT
jgi:dTMP kinase